MSEETKRNYCNAAGVCTVPNAKTEICCTFFTPSMSNGLCIYRAWFEDKCLSPWALEAARRDG